jgi:hypothetical protein
VVREISLTRGYVALVDDEDYERVSQYRWHARVQDHTVYAATYARSDCRRVVYLHRLILNAAKGTRVDHRSGDGLDCRRENLRFASTAQNSINAKSRHNKYGYRGVSLVTHRGKYRAIVRTSAGRVFGTYRATPIEAAHDYDHLARLHHGEFAVTNFPLEGERAA